MTLLVERTALPDAREDWLEPEAERVASEVLRAVVPVLRLVVAVPEVLRLVRVFWSTVPVERVAEEPVLRLVVAVPEVLRLVRVFWSTLPAERVAEEPVLRLVVAVPEVLRLVELDVERPVLRLVRSF